MKKKPEVEITQNSDPLNGDVEEIIVSVKEDVAFAKCPHCPGIKCQRLGSVRKGVSATNAPSNMVMLKCLSCGNAFSTGY